MGMLDNYVPGPNTGPLYGAASHVSRSGLTASIYTTFAVATLFLSLRLLLRWRYNSRFLLDDYCMILGWLAFATHTILQTWQFDTLWYITYIDYGRISDSDPARKYHANEMARWQLPVTALFWTALWSVKASLLVTFHKLVHPVWWLRVSLYFVAVFALLAYAGCWAAYIATRETPYDTYILETKTAEHNARVSVVYATVVDILTDISIALLPMSILPRLQLSRTKKLCVGGTFCLGLFVVAVAIVRMTEVTCATGVDHIAVALWGAVETSTAIVTGSLLSFGGLLSKGIQKSKRLGGYSKQTDSEGSNSRSSRWSSASALRKPAPALAPPSDKQLISDQEGGDAGFVVYKTVEMDIQSEYEGAPRFQDALAAARRKELGL